VQTAGRTTSKERLVVIGGGQAAVQLIEVARQKGFQGAVTLIADEPVFPYQRPPLSKQYLAGAVDAEWLLYRPEHFYEKFAVQTIRGVRADGLDRRAAKVFLDDGSVVAYDKLALTTGARPRLLNVPGAGSSGVFYIRTRADVDGLRARLQGPRRVVIVGAGFIGLETAAVLTQQGHDVLLLAADTQLLPRLLATEMATFLLDHHLMRGVRVIFNVTTTAIETKPDGALDVSLTDGRRFEGDLVLIGIGALPNVELGAEAGLEHDNGLVVDEFARTSDPAIVAAGDCTNHPNPLLGRRLRLETVHNAVEQGRTAGATIAGADLPYVQQPWVWSDQYGMRLQSVGVAEGYDATVLRGSPASCRFSLFYFRGRQMLAVNCINQPHVFGATRRILNAQLPVSPEEAADPVFDLTSVPPRTTTLEFDVPWPTRFEKAQAALAWGFE